MEKNSKFYDVIVIGGGLAGLSAATSLAQRGVSVVVIEKDPYPRHRVCGEYLSHEIIPYLSSLGIDLEQETDVRIKRLEVSTQAGEKIETELPLGALGISRFRLDEAMYERAVASGAEVLFDLVTSIDIEEKSFSVSTKNEKIISGSYVIGAFGKRSSLDRLLGRSFFQKEAPWIGVKAHYKADEFPGDLVALHNFEGGYCGLSKTEEGAVNVCYLANYKSFKKYKNIGEFTERVIEKNPLMKGFFRSSRSIFENPKTIAQISFDEKSKSENGIIMCGDSAGLIHPLCGNGMAMAIHSGKIAADLISKQIKEGERNLDLLTDTYEIEWKKAFEKRLLAGRMLQKLLLSKILSNLAMKTVVKSPWLIKRMIQMTHGDVILG